MIPQNPAISAELLNRGMYPTSAGASAMGANTLSTHLLGANILNDKDKFEVPIISNKSEYQKSMRMG